MRTLAAAPRRVFSREQLIDALYSDGREIVELENGFRIYHAGDTAAFGDMRLIGERFKPDLALVPIGGNFTMDPAEAAWAVKELIRPKAVIPMHYGTNPLARGTATQFVEAMGTGAIAVHVAVPGQPIRF